MPLCGGVGDSVVQPADHSTGRTVRFAQGLPKGDLLKGRYDAVLGPAVATANRARLHPALGAQGYRLNMNLESNTLHGGVQKPVFLSSKEAARFFTISHRTLEDWRYRGGGPVFRKLGRLIRYKLSDLIEFADAAARTNTGGGVPA